MVTDTMCSLGLAAHVTHLLMLVINKINVPTMEVTMRINFHDVWKFVAQAGPEGGRELTCAGKMGNALSKA